MQMMKEASRRTHACEVVRTSQLAWFQRTFRLGGDCVVQANSKSDALQLANKRNNPTFRRARDQPAELFGWVADICIEKFSVARRFLRCAFGEARETN